MTEHPDPPDHHEHAEAGEPSLDAGTLDALRSVLNASDRPEPAGDLRTSQIAAALAAYDDALTAAPTRVVSLDARRRTPARWLTAVAAAAVIVVGVGVGVRAGLGSSADQSDVAGDAAVSSMSGAADRSAEKSLPGDDTSAPASVPPAFAAPQPAESDQATNQFSTATVGDLGSFDTTDALAAAVLDTTTATTTAARSELPATGPSGAGAGGPTTISGASNDLAPVCPAQVAALGSPRFSAIVAGRSVVAAPSSGPGGGVDVVHLDDCSLEVTGR